MSSGKRRPFFLSLNVLMFYEIWSSLLNDIGAVYFDKLKISRFHIMKAREEREGHCPIELLRVIFIQR